MLLMASNKPLNARNNVNTNYADRSSSSGGHRSHSAQLGDAKHSGASAPASAARNLTEYLHNNNYRLSKIIGEGSYSKVKLATRYLPDGTASYRLACKIINKRRASGDFVSKFLPRELDVLSKIEHKHIVHVYDLVQFEDNVYIFMDWCDKGDLLDHIKAKGHISEGRSKYYFRQLVSAVHYLHGLDYSHRDLKCENILMKSQKDQLLISDFGFARHCRDENGKRVLSSTYCGSAAYASPEILQGVPYNPKLYDLWSLGCVLFIMLTGHMPYDESNVPKMLKTQLDRILHYPSPSDKNISQVGKSCVGRMLEPDVTRRANIDQVCNHEWLATKTSRKLPQPESAGGDHAEFMTPSPSPRFNFEPSDRANTHSHQSQVGFCSGPQHVTEPPPPLKAPRTPQTSRVPVPETPRGGPNSPKFTAAPRVSDTATQYSRNIDDSGYFTPSPSTPATPRMHYNLRTMSQANSGHRRAGTPLPTPRTPDQYQSQPDHRRHRYSGRGGSSWKP